MIPNMDLQSSGWCFDATAGIHGVSGHAGQALQFLCRLKKSTWFNSRCQVHHSSYHQKSSRHIAVQEPSDPLYNHELAKVLKDSKSLKSDEARVYYQI